MKFDLTKEQYLDIKMLFNATGLGAIMPIRVLNLDAVK